MLFASVIFVFFFLPIVFLIYRLIPTVHQRNLFLLLASIAFYFWGEKWQISILLATVIINFLIAIRIDRATDPRNRKIALWVAVVLNVGALLYFKYSTFIVHNFNLLLSSLHVESRITEHDVRLPLGISFFVFHALSYVIDTYHKKFHAENRFSIVSLYFFLFPHQIAGPIVRYELFAKHVDHHEGSDDILYGIERFIQGLAKKVLIANSLSFTADTIFGLHLQDLSSPLAWLGIIAYTLQIYFDFSGYSDMAIGLARMFGFHFHENFMFPYSAKSVTDFWRRWHISLSSWFRDYVYIPLGGNRASKPRTLMNLGIVFVLCGLWHGANWTFVFWGVWHGAFLIIERLGFEEKLIPTIPLKRLWTLVVVMFGWVFFRANDLELGFQYLGRLVSFHSVEGDSRFYLSMVSQPSLYVAILLGIVFSSDQPGHVIRRMMSQRRALHTAYWLILFALFVLSMSRLADGTFNPFIYFRF